MPHRHLHPHSKQPLASSSLSRLMRRSPSSPWLRGHKVCLSVGIFAAMLSTACGDPKGDTGVDAAQLASVTMFVTETRQNANFGGIAGADALCAQEAASAGLQGEYKAWLSTSSSSVASRLIQHDAPHVRVDGTVIANNWQDLVDGSIEAPINLDATGIQRGGDVWTGTLANGNSNPGNDCSGFTNGGIETALCGNVLATGPAWTEEVTPPCYTGLRLYCIQQ